MKCLTWESIGKYVTTIILKYLTIMSSLSSVYNVKKAVEKQPNFALVFIISGLTRKAASN